jgi:S-adenosylmethionine hydrolase
MIFLFTDFGAADIYVGQVKAVLAEKAPRVPVIDLLHDASPFNPRAGAHLLAALAPRIPAGSVVVAVVDPGVGGPREAVAVRADGRWFVGPDNGLLSVVAERARRSEYYVIGWWPKNASASFHGRDLFAPVAAMLARGKRGMAKLGKTRHFAVSFGPDDLAEVIYIDHYGNACTGLRAAGVSRREHVAAAGYRFEHALVFSRVAPGTLFWYENSLGLIEVAANNASAAAKCGLRVGDPVALERGRA